MTTPGVVRFLEALVRESSEAQLREPVLVAMTHGEIRPGHIARRTAKPGDWVLLDWGSAGERFVFYDLYVQELQLLRDRIGVKQRRKFDPELIDSLYRDPLSNPWSALRLGAQGLFDGFSSGWEEVFSRELASAIGVPLTRNRVRLWLVLAELERLAAGVDHKRTGTIALQLLGALVDASHLIAG